MSAGGSGSRKKKGGHEEHEEHVNHERWLVSYADMLTLLFVLFVVLFSMSNVDKKKFAELASGLSAGFGLSTPDEREAAVKTAIVRSSRRTVALVDSSKHGEESFVRFADLADLDVLITDRAPDPDLADALEAAGVEVVVA